MLKDKKNYNILFVVSVFALFWIFILLIGAGMLIFGEKMPMQLFVTISSWTPTIVLLIMFKKLIPHTSRRDYFKSLFITKINWAMLLLVTLIQLSLAFASIFIVSLQNEIDFINLLNLSLPMLSYSFFISLITGATGEESGWRGYLFPVMVKELEVIRGSILLGLIWGLWHAPLWFATSGFVGLDLLIYIVTFMVLIVCVSVIIGICYNHNKNLVIPMWIHLIVNFSNSFYGGSMENAINFITYLTILYVPTAFGFYLWHKRATMKSTMV